MGRRDTFVADIALIGFAALLLEVAYTRVLSFKFFHFYAFLVLGFALLGIGSGAAGVALLPGLRRLPLRDLLARACLLGALLAGVGYVVVAAAPFDTGAFWQGWIEPLKLAGIASLLFATFVPIGVASAALFARRPEDIRRLYGADLVGGGLGCVAALPLLESLGAPACIYLAGGVLALLAARRAGRRRPALLAGSLAVAAVLFFGVGAPRVLPDPVPDRFAKNLAPGRSPEFSRWGSVARVDVFPTAAPGLRVVMHDGILGTTLHRLDADPATLPMAETDPRSIPFAVLGRPPERVVVIGTAGGREIVVALQAGARAVVGVEVNPITASLLSDRFADFTGRLGDHPRVDLVVGEGRSFLARDDSRYDVVYLMSPESRAAGNPATSSAFILNESYLFTREMIALGLERLSEGGLLCFQLGEWHYDKTPLRTARLVGTARAAFDDLEIPGFSDRVLVATSAGFTELTTVLLKRAPFAPEEVARFMARVGSVPGGALRHAGGRAFDDGPVNQVIARGAGALKLWYESYRFDVQPVSDQSPFFWHFVRFRDALDGWGEPFDAADVEQGVGERQLIALGAGSILIAAVLALAPLLVPGGRRDAIPDRWRVALFFGAAGAGFLLYQVALIQKLTLLLGHPTRSLSVTVAVLLVSAGAGSLASGFWERRRGSTGAVLLAGIATWTAVWILAPVPGGLLAAPLAARVLVAAGVCGPLGFTLGAFVPLGVAALRERTGDPAVAVAWGWSVNAFAAVLGSVAAVVLAMSLGFGAVLLAGLAAYAVAALLLPAPVRDAAERPVTPDGVS